MTWKKKKSMQMAGHVHKDFIFYDYFSRRHGSLLQVSGNTPTGFICSYKSVNYAAKHVLCVAKKFLCTLGEQFFGEANKFPCCASKGIGEVLHNGRVVLNQVPSTWADSLYANTMRQFEGRKYGYLQFINIKDMVIKDTRIKSIQMTTSPKRSIQTTVSGYRDEFLSMLYCCVSKVIGGVFHRQQFFLEKPMNTRSVIDYMDLLPKEVIQEELLMRLPVKMLMGLNCVSKDWNDFISDDLFRRRYRSLQQADGNPPIGFICGDKINSYARAHGFCMANKFLYTSENYVEKEELECFDYLNTFGYVIAASKGLLLVGHNLNSLSVYDLVSTKHVSLPNNNLEGGDLVSLGFKCEESSSSSSNHHLCYKVVCVDNPGMDKYQARFSHKVEIYSSETGVWQKTIMKSELLPFQIWSRHIAKVIRGVFYWHEKYSNSFIAYDSEDPKGRVVFIELPRIDSNIFYRRKVRQLEGTKDGSLQFVSRDRDDSVLKVWILQGKSGSSYMDEYIVDASRWVLVYSVSLGDIYVGFSELSDIFKKTSRIIAVDPFDPHIIYLCIRTQLYTYNYRQGKVVCTWSQKMDYTTDVFVHLEWPTWPCL